MAVPSLSNIIRAGTGAFDAGGASDWIITTAAITMAAGDKRVASSATTLNLTLPTSVSAGQSFVVNAKQAAHRIVSNGNTIDGIGAGNDLLVDADATAVLVAYGTNLLRIV